MPIKLALTGRMRSGKDSVADYLARQYGFARFAFGDGIRKVCRELFPDQFRDNRNGSARKPRALLQGVGQAMRAFDESVWINACMRHIQDTREYLVSPINVVITDLRQPNEYERLRAEGFVIVRVNASDETRIQRMIDAGDAFTAADLEHETERHIDTFAVDYEIENNGSLAELHAKVDAVMAEIMAKEAAE
ncbi:AAA family ATPase [Brevibacillus sp. WF146]|uniref:deoxynucleotide monophosphate kinase family protein n=1 Tax=Brevibacillus sp. WF146 TaxID=319501 RepID=UPI0007FE6BF4|nr:AAA family ATPase [Brevibacillus sp. WF146]UYZ12161.1 AAA family ATPase [Brevibacillus sp. WF146]